MERQPEGSKMSEQTQDRPDTTAKYRVTASDGKTELGTELSKEAADKLAQAHEGAKVRKIKQARPALDLGTMTASIVKGEAVAKRRRIVNRDGGGKARTPAQLAVDKLVEATYQAWVKAGKPAKWEDRPAGNVRVLNVQAESLTSAVHSATGFLSAQEGHAPVKAMFGQTVMTEDKGVRYADMMFTVIEKTSEASETDKAQTEGAKS
jgi:hypothetical protein